MERKVMDGGRHGEELKDGCPPGKEVSEWLSE